MLIRKTGEHYNIQNISEDEMKMIETALYGYSQQLYETTKKFIAGVASVDSVLDIFEKDGTGRIVSKKEEEVTADHSPQGYPDP